MNNRFLPKITKFRKLVMRAISHGSDMQEHHRVSDGGEWPVAGLHVEFELNIAPSKPSKNMLKFIPTSVRS